MKTLKRDERQATGQQVAAVVSWLEPQNVDSLTVAFPANVIGKLLPLRESIPEEFWKHSNKWNEMAAKLFYEGGQLPQVKSGIEPDYAKRHLQAVLGSYEPQHEHKMAGAGYLMSLWYQSS